ncbi:heme exporter protein CcmD [Shinella daejeonensis]|uniref:heme exporter protein CcmD n=1 Tax=Shinella daejeonensis TaxID=659017 RepID=UPI0020C77EE4|nr:heme exporter protein CcmD [Shinella daejeonensis]MCP8894897.1 heme exporter protein CcmD [Shinella daejeonensis]
MSHAFYVAVSYAATFATVAGLVLWVWLDHRARRRELEQLEAAGVRRRSARPAAKSGGQP